MVWCCCLSSGRPEKIRTKHISTTFFFRPFSLPWCTTVLWSLWADLPFLITSGLWQRYTFFLFSACGSPSYRPICHLMKPQSTSLVLQSGSWPRVAGECLPIPWTSNLFYSFSLLPLIGKVLNRIHTQSTHCHLITPFWPQQWWLSELLLLSKGHFIPF